MRNWRRKSDFLAKVEEVAGGWMSRKSKGFRNFERKNKNSFNLDPTEF